MIDDFDSARILNAALQRASHVTRIKIPTETLQILLAWSHRNTSSISQDLADNLVDSEDLIVAAYLQVLDAEATQRHLARRGTFAEISVVPDLSLVMSGQDLLNQFGQIQDYNRRNELSPLAMAVSMVRSCRYPPFGRVRC